MYIFMSGSGGMAVLQARSHDPLRSQGPSLRILVLIILMIIISIRILVLLMIISRLTILVMILLIMIDNDVDYVRAAPAGEKEQFETQDY